MSLPDKRKPKKCSQASLTSPKDLGEGMGRSQSQNLNRIACFEGSPSMPTVLAWSHQVPQKGHQSHLLVTAAGDQSWRWAGFGVPIPSNPSQGSNLSRYQTLPTGQTLPMDQTFPMDQTLLMGQTFPRDHTLPRDHSPAPTVCEQGR